MGQNISPAILAEIKPGNRVFVHGQSATPYRLIEQFVALTAEVPDLEYMHLHVEGTPAHLLPSHHATIRINNFFIGPEVRKRMDGDRVDYTPIFLSEVPALFKSGAIPVDVALVHVSPPDRNGFCSLGIGVDIARAAVDSARIIIAQINPQMPRVFGDSLIHIKKFHATIEWDAPLPEKAPTATMDPSHLAIGKNVASLIRDGATLQVGIGAIPEAVLQSLRDHRHLGVHSELWSDGMMDLIARGVVDNSRKIVHPGKSIASFLQGSRALYAFVHDNPSVELYPADYVNSPLVIARNPQVIAINSAVQLDLTGQVCADSVGHRMISGIGGQVDFMRGSALSPGGKPIIALTSQTRTGVSRIVSELNPGAGVVTTRGDVHYVVTEYGVAELHGKTLGQRAKSLIAIAHPTDRERLTTEWKKIWSRA